MSINIELDETTQKRLTILGQKINQSALWIIQQAIEQYLSEQEHYWEEREDDIARWKEYLLTGEHIPHDEVTTWLDSIIANNETSCQT